MPGPKLDLKILNEIFTHKQLPESFGITITELTDDSVTGELLVDKRHLRPGEAKMLSVCR